MQKGKSPTLKELLAEIERKAAREVFEKANTQLFLSNRMKKNLKRILEGPPGNIVRGMRDALDRWAISQDSERLHDVLREIFSPYDMYLDSMRTRNS